MKFSVCICVYIKDEPQYFYEALNSLINQSLLPNQIVLVVDGPIETTIKNIIVQFFEDCKNLNIEFDVIYLEKNLGHGEARRISIENAKYKYIALMDADDLSMFDRFYKQIEAFKKNPEVSIIGGQILEIEHDTKKVLSKRVVPCSDVEIKKYMKRRSPLNQMTVMFRKKAVVQAGGYKDFYHNEDYYLWIRMYLNNCTFKNLDDVLVNARVNSKFYSRRGNIKYFMSEFNLQKIMLKNSIIRIDEFLFNIIIRFIIQVLLPSSVRGIIFQKLFRKSRKKGFHCF